MSRFVKILLAAGMVLSLAACAQKEEAAVTEDTQTASETDTQNPAMNFAGTYAAVRPFITVACKGKDEVEIEVHWGSSASQSAEWKMSGKFDPETLTVTYNDCTKKELEFNEDGEVEKETVVYTNGKGTITFKEGEKSSLTWQDDQENAAEDLVFEYAN